jgi:hypothetical protein
LASGFGGEPATVGLIVCALVSTVTSISAHGASQVCTHPA